MKVSDLIEVLKHEDQDNEIVLMVNFKTKNNVKLPCGFASINKMGDKEGYLHDRGKSIFIIDLRKEDDENYISNNI